MAKRGRKREAKVEAVTPGRLKSFVDRIVKLMEEREAIGGDIADVFTEAKSIGYDAGTMRKVIRIFRMDAADRAAESEQLEIYLHALGLVDRVQNRVAAGETLDSAAKAEGITKSRAHRIVSKSNVSAESEQIDESTGEITEKPGPVSPGAAEAGTSDGQTLPAASAANLSTQETDDGRDDFGDGSGGGAPQFQPERQGRGDGDQAADGVAGNDAGADRPAQRQGGDRRRDGGNPTRPDGEHVGGVRGDQGPVDSPHDTSAGLSFESVGGPSRAAADCGASPEPAEQSVNASPYSEVGTNSHATPQPPEPTADTVAEGGPSSQPSPDGGVPAGAIPDIGGGVGQESCGGGESRPAKCDRPIRSEAGEHPSVAEPAKPQGHDAATAGVATGPHDTRTWDEIVPPIPAHLKREKGIGA